jgi:DNA-binding NarL/FixJ family response regulator
MIVLVQATVLSVGLDGITEVLRELPIRVVSMRSGREAASSLKTERVDSVISNWQLDDMEDGEFLRKLRSVKPDIPTIAIVRADDPQQEISARSLGISAVLSDQTSDEMFRQTVANILGLKEVVSIQAISPVGPRPSRQQKRQLGKFQGL